MEKSKTVSMAQRVKAIAITFIGAGIFNQGTLYFKEQASYNIPRILYPVFELLGNKGLAVAMLILGLALLFWGYTKWRNFAGKAGVFAMMAIASFAIFFSILFFTGNKKVSTDKLIKTSDENRAKAIANMEAMDQPDFNNPEMDQHFASFETLLQQYSAAHKNKNQHEIEAKEADFMTWNKNSAELMQKLETPEQKQQFALYLGKLVMMWQKVK